MLQLQNKDRSVLNGRSGFGFLLLCTAPMFFTCNPKDMPTTPTVDARAVTADIQAGIEKHIREKSAASNGYFKIGFSDKELKLKLVRVHVEYLAALGPNENFACVDLADTTGDVYDVDFFMKGPPGNMKVTQTTVHKINGQPFYAWKQNSDHRWHQVPVSQATNDLLGVIEGKDKFDFTYFVKIPPLPMSSRMWLPIPVSDEFQIVQELSITAPGKQTMLNEVQYGNRILMLDLPPSKSKGKVQMRFRVERKEKSPYEKELINKELFLSQRQSLGDKENFKQIVDEVLKGKEGVLVRARAIFDHVIDKMSYKKVGLGWGKGDEIYACDTQTGNCSDFHAYFIALSRAANIPARFAVGASIPSSRNEGGIGGYHCWAEFYAEGKWWPVDISEADKYSALSTYYFGHHPANRIELSRGRDLEPVPGPTFGPINFLAYPVLEIDGKPKRIKPKFSFARLSTLAD